MPSLSGITHVTLTVRNLRASAEWYCEVFGFEQVDEDHQAHHDAVLLEDPASATVLSLRQHYGGGTARFDETRTGLDHVSFGVARREELDEWDRWLAQHHVERSSVTDTPRGAVLVCRDPDHIQLELFFRSAPAPGPPGHEDAATA